MPPVDAVAAASNVTWSEIGIVLGAGGVIMVAVIGWVWTALDSIRKSVNGYRLEVAQTYATVDALVQVESRLSQSIDKMAVQMQQSLLQMTTRFEALFTAITTTRAIGPSEK